MHRLTMSSHTVQHCRFDELLDATAAVDVHGIALTYPDYRTFLQSGLSDADMRAMADDAGVRIVDIEALYAVLEPDPDGRTARHAQRLFEIADQFGASSVGIHSNYDGDVEVAADRLGQMCDRAGAYGLSLGVEPVSVMGLSDLDTAWAVVSRTGRSNVGLVLDTWHFFRGAGTLEMLGRLPGEALRTVQISDGTVHPPADVDYLTDTLQNRLPPGEGEFDLAAVVRGVDAIGADVVWDMEICSTVLDALAPAEAARRSADATRVVLADARASVAPPP